MTVTARNIRVNRINLALGARNRKRSVNPKWTPLDLFAGGKAGVWYDPSDWSTLFQDTAGTTPVTAVGQSVALTKDKSGNAYHASQSTSGYRPTLQQDGPRFYLSFDGTDDYLTAGPSAFSPGVSDFLIAVGGLINGASGTLVSKAVAASTTNRYALQRYLNNFYAVLQLNSSVYDLSVADTPTTPRVIVDAVQAASTSPLTHRLRINGTTVASTSLTQQTLSLSNSYRLLIGAYNNSGDSGQSVYLPGRIYGVIIVATAFSDATMQKVERYLADKSGVGL